MRAAALNIIRFTRPARPPHLENFVKSNQTPTGYTEGFAEETFHTATANEQKWTKQRKEKKSEFEREEELKPHIGENVKERMENLYGTLEMPEDDK